jgi:hypothetical protein
MQAGDKLDHAEEHTNLLITARDNVLRVFERRKRILAGVPTLVLATAINAYTASLAHAFEQSRHRSYTNYAR